MDLRPGDLFATNGRGFLATSIRAAEWFWSTDNSAPYNHLGFVVDAKGRTLEARWRFKFYDLANYIGSKVYIVRHKDMTPERFAAGFRAVSGDIGCLYPVWRLPLHLLRIAKLFRFGPGVCSEQTGKFLKGAGFKNIVYGLNPEDYVCKWEIDRDVETIFRGVLTEDILNKLKEGAN